MNPDQKPRIGITTKTNAKEYLDRWFHNYWWAVAWAGGEPVVLTPETANPDPEAQVAQLDGLLLSGGGDVHPYFFGEPMNGADPSDIHVARDELELPLAKAALSADLPILGVCRGMQVLNIAAGGSLLQHVDGHSSSPEAVTFHDVEVRPGTPLARVLDHAGRLRANSFHHQAITTGVLAPDFEVAATTTAGPPLLEAMVGRAWHWVVAVQWHPERFFELDASHRRLFTEFVRAAGEGGRRTRKSS
jgi:putative glutamine amidotransferase